MNKAFTKENDDADDDDPPLPFLPSGGKNYITPQGYARIRNQLLDLIDNERPKVVEIVHWAASNGDRSENGDYIYGKKRLREIPDGHFKFPHLWPVKFPQAGRLNYQSFGLTGSDLLSW